MVKKKLYNLNEQQKFLRQRKRNRVNIRHNSPSGRSKGQMVWVKTRRRVRRRLLGR